MDCIKSLMFEKVLSTILVNQKTALEKLNIEYFHVYNFLKNEYQQIDNITEQYVFQFTY